jgi:hypothetical protein
VTRWRNNGRWVLRLHFRVNLTDYSAGVHQGPEYFITALLWRKQGTFHLDVAYGISWWWNGGLSFNIFVVCSINVIT